MDDKLRYVTKRKIGSGGMAVVYLAHDKILGREIAMKVLHPHLAESEKARKRFENEASAIAALSHENIVKIFDFGITDEKCFLVMEYLSGNTLLEFIRKFAPIPNLVILSICHQLFSGLKEAHGKGICHRDIKPSNLMIDNNGYLKIMDFGIAHLMGNDSMTMTGSFMGSPNFMSPEQVAGKRVTEKTDVFSAGLVAYMCATGEPAFAGETINHVFHAIESCQPAPVFMKNQKILPDLSNIIDRCLKKDPQDRPSAAECCSIMESFRISEKMTVSRNRITGLIENSTQYKILEDEELFNHFHGKAKESFKRKNKAIAIKELSIASCFGTVSEFEKKILYKAGKGNKNKRLFFLGTCFLFCAIASLLFFRSHTKRFDNHNTALVNNGILKHGDSTRIESVNVPQKTIPVQNERINPGDKFHVKSEIVRSNAAAPVFVDKNNDNAILTSVDSTKMKKNGNAIVYIKTNPPWTKISVDGIFVGEYPTISFAIVSVGNHTVSIQKDGFQKVEFSIDCNTNDTIEKRIQLSPNP